MEYLDKLITMEYLCQIALDKADEGHLNDEGDALTHVVLSDVCVYCRRAGQLCTWSEDVLYVTLSILVLTNYPSSVNVELADIKTYDREYSIIGRRLLATQIISGVFKTPPDAGVCHQA